MLMGVLSGLQGHQANLVTCVQEAATRQRALLCASSPEVQVAGSQGMHPMEGLLYIGSACTMCLMAQVRLAAELQMLQGVCIGLWLYVASSTLVHAELVPPL
jgi:hypothetical protein